MCPWVLGHRREVTGERLKKKIKPERKKGSQRSKSLGNLEESTPGITPKNLTHEEFYGEMKNGPERYENVPQKQKTFEGFPPLGGLNLHSQCN